MATLFRIRRYRIVVYSNDHGAAHVHVVAPDGHAKFILGESPNDVALVETIGITTRDLRAIAAAIIDRHASCRAGWKRFHGY